MIKRAIPSSGELLPVIGLGTWIQFDIADNNSAEKKNLSEVLSLMKENESTLIDSSPMYGRSEKVVGDLTQQSGYADAFFYATKVWTTGKEEGIKQINDSFSKMKRNVIDLMQIHNLVGLQTHLKTLRILKDEGKIRYIGITHYTVSAHEQLEKIIEKEKIDFVQFNYSIKTRNAEKRLLDLAKEKGVAVIINEPLEKGSLFQLVKNKTLPEWATETGIHNWTEFFLKYILIHPAVNCIIAGSSAPQHILQNINSGNGIIPSKNDRKKMISFFDDL